MRRTSPLLLLLLGILTCGSAWSQNIGSVRVGLSIAGARFLVDGQEFRSTQNFLWPEGSKHTIQFRYSLDLEGNPSNFQFFDNRVARYNFSGWEVIGADFPVQSSQIITITASSKVTEVIGAVTLEHMVHLEFPAAPPDHGSCAGQPGDPNDDVTRYGIVYIDGQCYGTSVDEIWVSAGIHNFEAYPYPGWVFRGFYVDNQIPPDPFLTTYSITAAVEITPVFIPAKRVSFTTDPPGLKMLVDSAIITPQPVPPTSPYEPVNIDPANCSPEFTAIPPRAPVGYKPLCAGDYDFLPGSVHRIGAPESQTDANARYWVFDHFSNGMGQNAIFTADTKAHIQDNIVAHFVPGVPARVITNPTGMIVEVDGRNDYIGPGYGFIWGWGHSHAVNAPAQQRDSKGRMWRFVGWSDGGDPSHTITVPTGAEGYALTATYELLGQVKITSSPAGMKIDVAGNECTTPCLFDNDAGEQLTLTAPARVPIGEGSRYEFTGWGDGSSESARAVTFNEGAQVLQLNYRRAHLVVPFADPAGEATFEFNPPSPDGFYPEGVDVEVTIVPAGGYKFLRWNGDLSGKFLPGRLKVLAPRTVIALLEEVPFIAPAGIRNAAGETPDGTVAPGSIISIYGENLSEVFQIGPANPLAQTLGNIWVTVDTDDKILPLLVVSKGQINAQLLSGLSDGTHTLKVHQIGKEPVVGTFEVRRNAPGIFYNTAEDGTPVAAALHQDGTVITQDSPAHAGEIISLYGTGLGPYERPLIDGFIAPTAELYRLADSVAVLAGPPASELPEAAPEAAELSPDIIAPEPIRIQAYWAGAAPGLVGASIVQMMVEDGLPGDSVELYLDINGAQSNRVQIPIE